MSLFTHSARNAACKLRTRSSPGRSRSSTSANPTPCVAFRSSQSRLATGTSMAELMLVRSSSRTGGQSREGERRERRVNPFAT